jgi:hypothetical protein
MELQAVALAPKWRGGGALVNGNQDERYINGRLIFGSGWPGYNRGHDGEGDVPYAANQAPGGDSPMFRKTALGFAAAATVAIAMATTASTASAGAKVQFHFGVPAYGYGYGYHAPYGYGYGAPVVNYHCPKVFVGYKSVSTKWGWKKKPMYKRHCY